MVQQQSSATYYLETAPGLEEVAWLEVRRRFPRAEHVAFLYAKDEHGIVVFRYSGDPAALFELRLAEALYLLVAYLPDLSRGYRDLNQLSDRLVRSGDLAGAVNRYSRIRRRRPQTHQLVARKYGQHQYDRKQFRLAVARTVDQLGVAGQRIQKDADLLISAGVYGSTMLLGLLLPPPAGRQVNAAQAAAVLLAQADTSGAFLDPYCGSGPVLAERQRLGRPELLLGGTPEGEAAAAAHAWLGGSADICRWHPGALPLAPASCASVASVWPELPRATYAAWLRELERVLQREGHAAILVPAYDLFRDALRDVPALQIERGYSARIGERWGRLYIITRAGT
jgi:tRNA (guanine6-N2)-methyltransferase